MTKMRVGVEIMRLSSQCWIGRSGASAYLSRSRRLSVTRRKRLRELLVSQRTRRCDAVCVHRIIPSSRSSGILLILELLFLRHDSLSIRPTRRRQCSVHACAIGMLRSHERECRASGSLLERDSEAKTRRPRIWMRPGKRLCPGHCRVSSSSDSRLLARGARANLRRRDADRA